MRSGIIGRDGGILPSFHLRSNSRWLLYLIHKIRESGMNRVKVIAAIGKPPNVLNDPIRRGSETRLEPERKMENAWGFQAVG